MRMTARRRDDPPRSYPATATASEVLSRWRAGALSGARKSCRSQDSWPSFFRDGDDVELSAWRTSKAVSEPLATMTRICSASPSGVPGCHFLSAALPTFVEARTLPAHDEDQLEVSLLDRAHGPAGLPEQMPRDPRADSGCATIGMACSEASASLRIRAVQEAA